MKIAFYGGPLDGLEQNFREPPDEWEGELVRHPRKRKMHYRRYTWPDRPTKPDVFVAEGYEGTYHDNLHGEVDE